MICIWKLVHLLCDTLEANLMSNIKREFRFFFLCPSSPVSCISSLFLFLVAKFGLVLNLMDRHLCFFWRLLPKYQVFVFVIITITKFAEYFQGSLETEHELMVFFFNFICLRD